MTIYELYRSELSCDANLESINEAADSTPHQPHPKMMLTMQPNIILIMADDLGYGDIGCFGSDFINTPNIDGLCRDGLTFTDYHSNGAVCTPTRAALLTGRYQQRSGLEGVIYVREREPGLDPNTNHCLATSLRAAGYATGVLGKWHLGFKTEFNPVHHGFDLFHGYVSGNVDYHSHVDNAGYPDWWHGLEQIEEEGYLTDLVNQHAVNFIREHEDHPFFLYVAHEAPHWPYQGRRDKADRFPGQTDFPSWGSRTDRKGAYKEMIEAMDDGVGMIINTLQELHLTDNTLVIFCSDNGAVDKVGSNGTLRGAKGSLFEGGHRVPALATWPGQIPPGSVTHETVMSMDWMPTFLKLAGDQTEPPKPLDGIDLSDLLFDQKPLPDRGTFFRYGKRAAARRGKWKLVRNEDEHYLFDLESDRDETTNLLDVHSDKAVELGADLDAWTHEVLAGVDLQTG